MTEVLILVVFGGGFVLGFAVASISETRVERMIDKRFEGVERQLRKWRDKSE